MVVAGQRRVRLTALEDGIGIGQQQRLDGGQPLLRLPSPRQASTVSRSSAIRASVCSACSQLMGRRRVLRAGVHPLQLADEHLGQVVERPRDLALEQRRHQRQPLRLDHPRQHVGGQAARLGGEMADLGIRDRPRTPRYRRPARAASRDGAGSPACAAGSAVSAPPSPGPKRCAAGRAAGPAGHSGARALPAPARRRPAGGSHGSPRRGRSLAIRSNVPKAGSSKRWRTSSSIMALMMSATSSRARAASMPARTAARRTAGRHWRRRRTPGPSPSGGCGRWRSRSRTACQGIGQARTMARGSTIAGGTCPRATKYPRR